MRIILIGHSHIAALEKAYRFADSGEKPLGGSDAVFINVRKSVEGHLAVESKSKDFEINPGLMRLIDGAAPAAGPVAYVSVLAGPVLAHMGLVVHPEPYDFDVPELAHLPLDRSVRTLHYETLATVVKAHVVDSFRFLNLLSARCPGPIFHLNVPPPIGDQEFISGKLHLHFPDLAQAKITSPVFRYKLWWLHSRIFMQTCDELGITFIDVPESATTPDGFLVPAAWDTDCVHANEWYGARMLEKLEKAAARVASTTQPSMV
jgi:hypothetical protein